MKIVTQADKIKINEAYLRLKTYAAVARETGFSPATVKKYVINDYVSSEEKQIVRFDRPLPDFDALPFRVTDWGPLCELSDTEKDEIKNLWKELDL